MKNILKFSVLAFFALTLAASCMEKELDTQQIGDGTVSLAAIDPNPVVRGAQLRIFGSCLDQIQAVEIPGVEPITEIERVAKEAGKKLEEIRITIPKEGPEVGKIAIVDKNGNRYSSKFDLTYNETDIVFESFESPEVAYSRDEITLKGDYLNNIQSVIFTDNVVVKADAFIAKDRHSLKIAVPGQAVTGNIKICDQIDPETSGATIIPSGKELVIGEPTVTVVEPQIQKAGGSLFFQGKHLDMIKKVQFLNAETESFEVNSAADVIMVDLPAEAQEGEVKLISYAGDEFVAGTVLPLNPDGLTLKTANKENRYKAGLDVVIIGTDLDLVTVVDFSGIAVYDLRYVPDADESHDPAIDSIFVALPFDAPDGVVTAQTANGTHLPAGLVEYVNPTVIDAGPTEIVARDEFEIIGEDLELVTGLTIGGIECKTALDTLYTIEKPGEDGEIEEVAVLDSTKLIITTSPEIVSGDVVITKANGWQETINTVTVSYNEPVSFEYESPSIQMGQPLTLVNGKNLFMIESIKVKGKKITSYVSRSDEKMAFNMPEGMGPGVYKLELTLIDGNVLTWAIPFEMTAPYTETTMWEGEVDLGNWSLNWEMKPADMFVKADAKEGDIFRIYGYATKEWWQVQTFDGHWGALDMGLGNGNNVNASIYDLSNGYIAIELDATRAGLYTTYTDWGYCGILQGENFVVTRLSLIKWGSVEKVTNIWEGSWICAGWGGNQDLAWGGYDWSKVKAGTRLRLTMTPTVAEGSWWCVSLRHGADWGNLPNPPVPGQYDTPADGILELELTDVILNDIVSNGGLVITGDGFTLTSVDLVE